MATRVLFLCPHSAGKSVLAATYFRSAAARTGLTVEIDIAGTDPDADIMPNVRDALEAQGYTVGWLPRAVSEGDLDRADITVNIGCDHVDLPGVDRITDWDVPMLSEDFDASVRAIHERAESLAAELARTGST